MEEILEQLFKAGQKFEFMCVNDMFATGIAATQYKNEIIKQTIEKIEETNG